MKLSRNSSVRSTKSDSAPSSPPPRRSNSVDSKPNTTTTSSPTRPTRSNSAPPPARPQPADVTGGPSRTRPRDPDGAARVNGPDAAPVKKPTTNSEIRNWYNQKVASIPANDAKLAAQGASLEDRAKAAVKIRHEARLEARSFMSNPLEVMMLKARDFFTYGRLDGPSFDQLVKGAKAKGLTGDDVYQSLIDSSKRTNQTVNNHFANPQAKL
ncbi:hypothetical protein OV207_23520 [Corallococcus sp. BB11-1]|uniref:hypothetical protein n=1 Tax=Corallococcus sp. BB11-1 TaxID=2996783 RepID=UPI00226ED85D|nr:hypothetical protein [Corallococcus sp. BB11-1]MCY1034441.1 hypothetical protein [Corallococcus sp. BB11-1]